MVADVMAAAKKARRVSGVAVIVGTTGSEEVELLERED